MKVKVDPVDDAADALGDAPETEFTFLLMPVDTYSILAAQAMQEQTSVGMVLQKAVLQYLRSANGVDQQVADRPAQMPEPDMVIRRKKRS